MDIEELKKQLLKVENSINKIVDNYDIKIELELEEYRMVGEKRTRKRYKVYGVIPEEFIR